MIFTSIHILLMLNFTNPIVERYDFEPNKICYVVDLGIKIKQNDFKSDTPAYYKYLGCIYWPPLVEVDREEKNKLSN